jgi:hypothetical protein
MHDGTKRYYAARGKIPEPREGGGMREDEARLRGERSFVVKGISSMENAFVIFCVKETS